MSDPNVPKVGEISFDLNLKSPIAEVYDKKVFIIQSAEKLIQYLAKQPQNSYNQAMLMMVFKQIALGEKIEAAIPIMTDHEDYLEGLPTVKFAKILDKSRHNLGEYSCEQIMRTKIQNYESQHQKHYDQYEGFIKPVKPDDDSQEQKTIRVNHYFFDTWTMIFNEKLEKLKKDKDPSKVSISDYEFSNMNLTMLEKYPKNLEHFLFMRNLVDHQFDRTKAFYKRLLIVYGVAALLYFLQIEWITGFPVILVNTVQLVIQVLFFINELIQLRDQGPSYFINIYNYFELAHFGFFVFYYVLRLTDTECTVPPHGDHVHNEFRTLNQQTLMTILNMGIIITGTLKVFFYVRIFEEFGWIVELIGQCLKDMFTFTIFYMFLLFIYGTLYIVGGVNGGEADDSEGNVLYWVSVFRYSIGDIFDLPTYAYWEKNVDSSGAAKTVILINLVIFISQLFLMLIVMLNFLIAVISQTYENIMSKRVVASTLQKAEMNRECRLLLKTFNYGDNLVPFIVSFQPEAVEDDVWEGFVVTIKHFFNRKVTTLHQQMRGELKDMLKEIRAEFKDIKRGLNSK